MFANAVIYLFLMFWMLFSAVVGHRAKDKDIKKTAETLTGILMLMMAFLGVIQSIMIIVRN